MPSATPPRPLCRVCHGSGRVHLAMYECNHCAGSGYEYPLEVVAEGVHVVAARLVRDVPPPPLRLGWTRYPTRPA